MILVHVISQYLESNKNSIIHSYFLFSTNWIISKQAKRRHDSKFLTLTIFIKENNSGKILIRKPRSSVITVGVIINFFLASAPTYQKG